MGFNSFAFILYFLPVMLAVYYLVPERWKNGALALGSLAFYFFGVKEHPWWAAVLAALTLASWGVGIGLEKSGRKKWVLWSGLALLLGVLTGFKLAGLLGGTLPLGVSFYTFQMASYLIDIQRGGAAERNLTDHAASVLMFPKLISGPLIKTADLRRQMTKRKCSMEQFDLGLREFITGLGLKVLLADRIGGLWQQVQALGFESISTPLAWIGLAAYALQLYFDFYGYSTMAVGLGRMLGFRLPQNFNHPYAARSMSEFWRRWHITLGAWFRDYVYIPLGGSRRGKGRTVLNLLVVWLLTGLWHGGHVNFILWGLFIWLLIVNEKLWLGRLLEKSKALSHCYLLLTVLLSWLLFAVEDLGQIGIYLGRLFPLSGGIAGARAGDFLQYGRQYGLLLLVGVLFATPWPMEKLERIRRSPLDTVLCFAIFWAVIYCLAVTSADPFLYSIF